MTVVVSSAFSGYGTMAPAIGSLSGRGGDGKATIAPLEVDSSDVVVARPGSALALNARVALKSGAIIGASLFIAGMCKSATMAGLGELHKANPSAALGVNVGMVGLSSVMIVPGVRAFVRALEPVTGKLPDATVHALTLVGWAGAMAAALMPGYMASRSKDSDFLVPFILANSAAQVVMSLAAEAMAGPVLGAHWPRVHMAKADGTKLLPGTPAYADHIFKDDGFKKVAALTLPSFLAHAGLAAGASHMVDPLSRLLCGAAPAEVPFGSDPYKQFMSTLAVMTSVAVVEACRMSFIVGSQAFAHSFWDVSTREDAPAPRVQASQLPMAVGACASLCKAVSSICSAAARIVRDDDARLRMFIFSTFLNLTVAALVIGPTTDVVKGLSTSDDDDQLKLTAFLLSLFANAMLGVGDAAVPLARRARVEEISEADFCNPVTPTEIGPGDFNNEDVTVEFRDYAGGTPHPTRHAPASSHGSRTS
ncbi:MAG TPA: hypothetical protein VLJ86_09390 [Ramlibacter sp.]|nr:hypothetical protein [Ramlibacter sp.]